MDEFEYFAEVAPGRRQYFDIIPLSSAIDEGVSEQCGAGCAAGFYLSECHQWLVCEGCGARFPVRRVP